LIDKPSGVTSHDVVHWARKTTGHKTIGHTGTLDPLATGLLVLLITRKYTKMQAEFLKQDKSYLVTAQLGIKTDSYDCDGKVVSTADRDKVTKITQKDIQNKIKSYQGEITQQVPIFSAVKIKGKKLYEIARKNPQATLQLPSRVVTIYSCELVKHTKDEKNTESSFALSVRCSSGTYIRSLVNDIGNDLGVGAVVTALRRTSIGELRIDDALLCPLLAKKHSQF
ncbi:MAG: tRNA pseudouridine(55) synthase TruB, partial [Microgenomates group bacterium]